jgi:hypothetical protein
MERILEINALQEVSKAVVDNDQTLAASALSMGSRRVFSNAV